MVPVLIIVKVSELSTMKALIARPRAELELRVAKHAQRGGLAYGSLKGAQRVTFSLKMKVISVD